MGTDATVNEGWLDLKVCNKTENTFQVEIDFDDNTMYGRILAKNVVNIEYSVFDSSVTYRKQDEKIYQTASVCRMETDKDSGRKTERKLYVNRCQIGCWIPDNIKIEEGGI